MYGEWAGRHSTHSQAEGAQAEGSPGQKGHSLWESFQLPEELPALNQLHISKYFPVFCGPEEALECFHADPGQGGIKWMPETCQLLPTKTLVVQEDSSLLDSLGTLSQPIPPPLKILPFLGP